MYRKYTTDALVLKTLPSGEADALVTLFTRDIGLVRASARGSRREESKHRYALQALSLLSVSLVRGKRSWRITNAIAEKSIHRTLTGRYAYATVARVLLLLERLVAGEEADARLYEIIVTYVRFAGTRGVSSDAIDDAEVLTVLRMLSHLGYLKGRDAFGALSNRVDVEPSDLASVRAVRHQAIGAINESLSEAQLE